MKTNDFVKTTRMPCRFAGFMLNMDSAKNRCMSNDGVVYLVQKVQSVSTENSLQLINKHIRNNNFVLFWLL